MKEILMIMVALLLYDICKYLFIEWMRDIALRQQKKEKLQNPGKQSKFSKRLDEAIKKSKEAKK